MSEDKLLPSHIRKYSNINGLQQEHQVLYYQYDYAEGVVLEVMEQNRRGAVIESCYCPGLSSQYAADLLLFLYENSMSVGGWLDVLVDCGVRFQMSHAPHRRHSVPGQLACGDAV